jgi:hypothetical protein
MGWKTEGVGVKRESSVTPKSSINNQNKFHTTTNVQRKEKQPPSIGLGKERARRHTQTAGKKRRNTRQVILCNGKKEELSYKNTTPTCTVRRRQLPCRHAKNHPSISDEATVNKKEHGETYKLQTQRDEMRVRRYPAVGKRRKYHPTSFVSP